MGERPCLHCGRPESQHIEICGAGKVCAVSAFTYRPRPERTAEEERAAIVAWLRGKVDGFHAAARAQGKKVGTLVPGYVAAADAIERGDHAK